ncbi:MAG: hypothetical protein JWM41_4991 [Gemmatimonadetes bacterium]|nr:hypothetical protein [Gemmatimonadota bacterium]
MRARFGIEIGSTAVRAVMIRSGAVLWHTEVGISGAVPLRDIVESLLAAAPRHGFLPPIVGIALGPSRTQIKRLDGLPQLESLSVMTQLLREHASAVFLRTAGTLVIPEVYRSGDGTLWGAALDRAIADDAVFAVQRARLRVTTVVPTISAVAQLYPSAVVCVSDEADHFELTTERSAPQSIRRLALQGAAPAIPAQLRGIDGDAGAFIGAYAAAIATRKSPFSWRPEVTAAHAAMARRAQVAGIAVSLGLACVAAVTAPAARAAVFVRQARGVAVSTREMELEAARAEAELRRTTQLLETVRIFDANRGQITQLLGQLSRSIPESTAIVTFRVDSIEGSFVAIAPHVTDLLPEIGAVEEVAGARIVGSVTRETVAGVRLERAAFRFRRSRPSVAPLGGHR